MSNAAPGLRQPASRQIVGLDLIRFLAAIYVMCHHLGWRVWFENYAVPMNYHYFEPFFRPGFIGVEVFFVISGIVIAYSAQGSTAETFLVNRAVRLLPAAWFCSTVTIAIVYGTGHGGMTLGGDPFSQGLLVRWLKSLVLWPPGPWVDGSYWTLPIEMGFYLQVLLLLYFRVFQWLERWMYVLGSLSVVLLVLQSIATVYRVRIRGLYTLGPWLHHGCFFALGVLLFVMFVDRVTRERVAFCVFLLIGVFLDVRLRVEWVGNWWTPLTIWVVAMGGILASLRYNERLHEVLGAGGAKIARRLGVVTYPLYLVHQVAGYALLATLRPHMPDVAALLLTIAVMFCVAMAINLLLEEPTQRWLKAQWKKRTGTSAVLPVRAAR